MGVPGLSPFSHSLELMDLSHFSGLDHLSGKPKTSAPRFFGPGHSGERFFCPDLGLEQFPPLSDVCLRCSQDR